MSITGRHVSKLSGYAPALPTPFDHAGCIDAVAFERLCDLQLANGATALIVCGTTGEAPTLSWQDHKDLTLGRYPAKTNQKWMIKSLAAITAQFLDGGIPAFTLPLNASTFSER
jgi:hypothetical protein